ncbi:hypothetical protein M404DRAFT_1008670 [Pisolithus tinctorius Marx 270]|uniref:Uncharacterized protein n=1 Tax=Pisolithus tinctorius Marx 270 TaxID=870435 RepID=A0A0C3J8C9_PISTI|nr:hypothetical protein M404DRAFT_1008670 [Pisolithus tinctorius Marx 270]
MRVAVEGYTVCLSPFTNSKSIHHATTRSNDAHIRICRAYPRCRDILVLVLRTSAKRVHGQKQLHRRLRRQGEGIVVVVGDSR